jgi:predicted house-cleaning noncanonical NTP pyrophosphatase (MazG superfamily)
MDIFNKDFRDIFDYFKSNYKNVSMISEKSNYKNILRIKTDSKIEILISDEDSYYLANVLFENVTDFFIFSFSSAKEFITKFKLHKEWEFFVED